MDTFDAIDLTASEVLHPGSKQLFRYWEGLRRERGAPLRSELDLKQIKPIVQSLFILERHPLKQSFKWRLAGTGICNLWRRELTGQEFGDDWPAFERATLARLFDAVITQLQPGIARLEVVSVHGDALGIEMLCLPVRPDGSNSVQILGTMPIFNDAVWLGRIDIAKVRLSRARIIWTEPGVFEPDDLVVPAPRPAHPAARFTVIPGGLQD